ncbi:MAG TPA: hypothetical protein ENJ95_18355 [Bacteroidetes bacterium]|nr:hypothetical protein [Bacteroidota bacterium]
MNKLYFYFLFLLLQFSFKAHAQEKCTMTTVYHKYYNENGGLSGYLPYHVTLDCNFNVDDPDRLLDMKYDTIIEKKEIDLTRVDVANADNSKIIGQLYNLIEFIRVGAQAAHIPQEPKMYPHFFVIKWEEYFLNFGLLEGRALSGAHPRNGYCKVFVSFNFMTRKNIVHDIKEILDIKGQVCGEQYIGENGIEIFRVYFDNSASKTPATLLPSFLPRFLVD